MQLIMSNPTEREILRMRQDAHRDEVTTIAAAERTGEKRGVEREKRETAQRMKDKGFSVEDIIEITGLSAEDIESI